MKQINFLNALINNEKQLSSQRVLKKFELGTSANVIKIKKKLHDREIIDIIGMKIEFMDPLYKYFSRCAKNFDLLVMIDKSSITMNLMYILE